MRLRFFMVNVVAMSFGLFGCQSLYKPTESPNKAVIALKTKGVTMMDVFYGKECTKGVDVDYELLKRKDAELVVPSDSEIALRAEGYTGQSRGMFFYCMDTLSFVPKLGARYEARYQLNGERCSFDVVEVFGQGDDVTESPVLDLRHRTYKRPMFPGLPACEK